MSAIDGPYAWKLNYIINRYDSYADSYAHFGLWHSLIALDLPSNPKPEI